MKFDNSYARLPERFYTRTPPTPVAQPRLLKFNDRLAAQMGLALPDDPHTVAEIFAGNLTPEGAEPIALAYAGHQFGQFVPQLGDGRAVLLGEVVTPAGQRLDVQLKGSGRTPFSRGGDGRAAYGPVLREYLVSEAMHALGVPTTRSLAAVATGETVRRERPLPGAVLTRVAASHLRIGTFQYFAARRDAEAMGALVDYAIARHYPELAQTPNKAMALFRAVLQAQARLVARWLSIGFIHGVMNTDNTTISGETIDYGPCAFVDAYDHMAVFSSIDVNGRYAFANQAPIAQWNLARLAETLLPMIDEDQDKAVEVASEALQGFGEPFKAEWTRLMRRKLGLARAEEGDEQLAKDLLDVMHAHKLDFTLTFRTLAYHLDADAEATDDPPDIREWLARWRERQARETTPAEERLAVMAGANPAFIPRNHRVERALEAAANGDMSEFERLLAIVSDPFSDRPQDVDYARPPAPQERVLQTFCGT